MLSSTSAKDIRYELNQMYGMMFGIVNDDIFLSWNSHTFLMDPRSRNKSIYLPFIYKQFTFHINTFNPYET